jgi:hypothetical protein
MPVRLLDDIVWDGEALLVTGATENGRVTCRVPLSTIHKPHPYSDVISREIKLKRQDIVEGLAPFLIAKLSEATTDETLELFPWEVYSGPAPGSSNVRPALATVRASGPSIKRGGVQDPDGR